ncbi:MAG: hypothetical protein JWN08_411, partial [Frankiales bacterium]|nr:hypothetical protein [Frankiales bacterium]
MSVSRSEAPFSVPVLPDAVPSLRPRLYAATPRPSWTTRTVGAVHAGAPGVVAPAVDLVLLAAAS